MKNRYFPKSDFDMQIYGLFVYGDHKLIAAGVGSKPALISQYMNPNSDRESIIFRTACIFAEWIGGVDSKRGLAALREFVKFVLLADPNRQSVQPISLRAEIEKLENGIERVKELTDDMPLIRLEARKLVKRRRRQRKVR